MSYRNSFTNCIDAMVKLFAQNRYNLLHLVHNPQGKYYTVYTTLELENKLTLFDKSKSSNADHLDDGSNLIESELAFNGDRLVMSITQKELRILHERAQEDLFTQLDTVRSNRFKG